MSRKLANTVDQFVQPQEDLQAGIDETLDDNASTSIKLLQEYDAHGDKVSKMVDVFERVNQWVDDVQFVIAEWFYKFYTNRTNKLEKRQADNNAQLDQARKILATLNY